MPGCVPAHAYPCVGGWVGKAQAARTFSLGTPRCHAKPTIHKFLPMQSCPPPPTPKHTHFPPSKLTLAVAAHGHQLVFAVDDHHAHCPCRLCKNNLLHKHATAALDHSDTPHHAARAAVER
jgi:hypothetical protein